VRSGDVRLVLDTNTAVSGLIWGGVPGRLIDAAAAGKTQILSSVPLLDELNDVLFRKKFAAQLAEQGVDAVDLFEGYAALVRLVVPAVIGPVILADPDDDIVLATAVACGADLIVSGDAHLLGIGEFQGIPILTPSATVSRLAV
jgi:putative PIN family toxin of toxin-antitoxin system